MGLLSRAAIKHSAPVKAPAVPPRTPISGGSSSGGPKAPAPGRSAKRPSLAEVLTAYMRGSDRYQGVVLDLPEDAGDDRSIRAFHIRLSGMLGKVGRSFPLPSKRCLVLSAVPLDRELIGHRLAHSLHTSVLVNFEIDTPDKLFKQITPFLL